MVVDCTQTNAVGNVVSSSVPSADIYCYPCGAPDRIPPVGTVYGTGTYSGNSAICVAAAHSGKYKYGGPVKIYYSAYTGPFRGEAQHREAAVRPFCAPLRTLA